MKITSAEFLLSVFDIKQVPSVRLPEIAFMGRSNVGKSSLLNSLLMRKGLARTSNTPGRTQSINYFLINSGIYFVDLPGYGYAKVSKAMRSDWGSARQRLSYRQRRSGSVAPARRLSPRPDAVGPAASRVASGERQGKCDRFDQDRQTIEQRSHKTHRRHEKSFPGSKIFHYSASTGRGRKNYGQP